MSSCLDVGGTLDVSGLGVGCSSVQVSGSLQVAGSFVVQSDGSYMDHTTTTGTEHLTLGASCLKISGTTTTCDGISGPLSAVGFSQVTCTSASGGGCTCDGTVNQMGGIGVPSVSASPSGGYTTASNVLSIDSATDYGYCVAGGKLTLTPQNPNITGTIVLQTGSSAGTGGSTGSGGATGSGGSTGTGGMSTGSGGGGGRPATGGAGGHGGSGGSGGSAATGGSTGTGGGGSGRTQGPCDIYSASGTPCAAAYSTIRALSMSYTGPLYQVRSGSSSMNTGSGGTTKDIGITSDGYADTATQDTFCNGSVCTVSILYDQSGNGNNLKVAPAGLSNGGTYAGMPDFESSATKGMLTVSGHKVYSLYMNAREGYRLTAAGKGMPLGNKAQGIYILADGTHSGTACCWDFGDVSTDPTVYGVMNTVFFGTGYWGKGAGSGPWFMGDFEGGVWAGGSASTPGTNSSDPSMKYQFAFGIVKTSSPNAYAIRVANGNLPTASGLTTAYDGAGPKSWNNTGGILLGIGSDNSNNSFGTFYEGAITNGRPSDTTDASIMQNVQAAGYGK
jgi:hypothetical protein